MVRPRMGRDVMADELYAFRRLQVQGTVYIQDHSSMGSGCVRSFYLHHHAALATGLETKG